MAEPDEIRGGDHARRNNIMRIANMLDATDGGVPTEFNLYFTSSVIKWEDRLLGGESAEDMLPDMIKLIESAEMQYPGQVAWGRARYIATMLLLQSQALEDAARMLSGTQSMQQLVESLAQAREHIEGSGDWNPLLAEALSVEVAGIFAADLERNIEFMRHRRNFTISHYQGLDGREFEEGEEFLASNIANYDPLWDWAEIQSDLHPSARWNELLEIAEDDNLWGEMRPYSRMARCAQISYLQQQIVNLGYVDTEIIEEIDRNLKIVELNPQTYLAGHRPRLSMLHALQTCGNYTKWGRWLMASQN